MLARISRLWSRKSNSISNSRPPYGITEVDSPRALFETRTGRAPRYPLNPREAPDWAYHGEPLAPLKGFPGVMWERPIRSKKRDIGGMV